MLVDVCGQFTSNGSDTNRPKFCHIFKTIGPVRRSADRRWTGLTAVRRTVSDRCQPRNGPVSVRSVRSKPAICVRFHRCVDADGGYSFWLTTQWTTVNDRASRQARLQQSFGHNQASGFKSPFLVCCCRFSPESSGQKSTEILWSSNEPRGLELELEDATPGRAQVFITLGNSLWRMPLESFVTVQQFSIDTRNSE
jgi:hypothetical protein